jgi:hypothetical protein
MQWLLNPIPIILDAKSLPSQSSYCGGFAMVQPTSTDLVVEFTRLEENLKALRKQIEVVLSLMQTSNEDMECRMSQQHGSSSATSGPS